MRRLPHVQQCRYTRTVQTVRIIGTGLTSLTRRTGSTATELMQEALQRALANARIELRQLDGLIAVPALSHPHFMEAHYLATRIGLLPASDRLVRCAWLPQRTAKRLALSLPNRHLFGCGRTIDTGGAGPITALLEARRMILNENCSCVAVVAGASPTAAKVRGQWA